MPYPNKGANVRDRLKEKNSKFAEKAAEVRDLKKSNKDLENKFKRWVRLHEGHNISKAFQKSKAGGKLKQDRTLNQV